MNPTEKPFYEVRRQQFLSEAYYERTEPFYADESEVMTLKFIDSESPAEGQRWSLIASYRWRLMCLHYTAGHPIELMGDEFERVIEAREQESKAEGEFYEGPDFPTVIGGPEESYLKPLQFIGLAYLLHRRDLLPRIAQLMEGSDGADRGIDSTYEKLLSFNDPTRTQPGVYINEDYLDFQNAWYEKNTKEEALVDLTAYLKDWYTPIHEDQIWYNSHTDEDGWFYHGYWAFEAAALVYLLDLDDTSLHKFLYYPKDLVEYARSKPADSSPSPQPAPTVEPPPSRYTGYAVNVGEICQETGHYECPRLQGRIVMLTQGQKVLGDAYNQMGTIIWYKLTKEAEQDYLKNRK